MYILITGVAGFIGSKIAKRFIDEGYNLRPTEVNASFGIYLIKKVQEFNNHRKIFKMEIKDLKI